ncbi:cellulase family glycosylhydrolase [Streptomyces sp. HNM0575]|uniref:cellulase family glycosylhydrolase n=1 Tax=Streptomyces sp. HNM0575 TaxID=2716338 RepID=UPI00145D811E|nr:cellulase family glycosylhydrolase [Streptomyces sp. HNM0575]NLU71383.1 cellulase family glycosylhydrolase [Streptomyces sp. HNM0575]
MFRSAPTTVVLGLLAGLVAGPQATGVTEPPASSRAAAPPTRGSPPASAPESPAPTRDSPSKTTPVSAPGTAPGPEKWTPPLSTRGRYIVDADGDRFKLKSGNWHGASGTWTGSGDPEDPANHHSGENSGRIPLGLDRTPMKEIVAGFGELGLNSVRLPFSNEMIHDEHPVSDASVAANPLLKGRTPLQVYDAAVEALTDAGFAVILNNHTNTTRWCCGVDGNERWNASQTTETWENDWLFMARRYAKNPRVAGADLYNEVRRSALDDPNWGQGDSHDWFAASQHLGDRILQEADPDLLVIVEGINWTGLPIDGLPHGRPTLEPVQRLSHTLVRSGKLVYSAHFYGYTGPNHSGATGIGETSDPRYRDFGRAELYDVLRRQAFYVASQQDRHFTAPVWISEFGAGGPEETDGKERAWFRNFTAFLAETDADFAYWPLVGWNEKGSDNGWGLLRWDSAGRRTGVLDGGDWRAGAWKRLVNAPARTGAIPATDRWSMLSPDHGDFVASLRMREQGDWDSGGRKAACPDDQRLIGLSHTGARGLCTDTDARGLSAPGGAHEVVTDERHVEPGQDWASGYTKFQCPSGRFLTGYSVRGAAVSSALCTEAKHALGTGGRTVWFDRSDARPPDAKGGDFAHGHLKGQCADGEYAAGIAFTRRAGSSGSPSALLCRDLN